MTTNDENISNTTEMQKHDEVRAHRSVGGAVGDWRVHTDSAQAADLEKILSTSGGLFMLGPHCLNKCA